MITLSQNKARGVNTCPWLDRCFTEYFAPGQFVFDRSHLVDVKWRGDRAYVVMLFRVGDEYFGADVAGYEENYEVCNDAIDFDEKSWKTVRVDPYCDGFTTIEDRE